MYPQILLSTRSKETKNLEFNRFLMAHRILIEDVKSIYIQAPSVPILVPYGKIKTGKRIKTIFSKRKDEVF
jgi:uncharacterized protein with PQ loop repeat